MVKKVVRDGWCVSYTTGTGIKGVELSVFKVINQNPYKIRYGDHHGKIFASQEEADAFTLERGYCKTWTRADREQLKAEIRARMTAQQEVEERAMDNGIKIIQFDDMNAEIKDDEVIILVAPINAFNNSYSVCEHNGGRLIPLASPSYNLTDAKDKAKQYV